MLARYKHLPGAALAAYRQALTLEPALKIAQGAIQRLETEPAISVDVPSSK